MKKTVITSQGQILQIWQFVDKPLCKWTSLFNIAGLIEIDWCHAK